MKLKIIIISIIVILSIIVAYLIFSDKESSISKSKTDFAINDTSIINKIIITKDKQQIIISKKNNKWKLNQNQGINSNKIQKLLVSITLIKLKTPIPNKAQAALLKKLRKSKKIEFYNNEKKIKSYFIGEQISDKSGNYMLLENAEEVFAIYIPSFKMDLSTIFSLDEYYWKSKVIFEYNFSEINSIELIYPAEQQNSFYIKHNENDFTLKNLKENNSNRKYIEDKIVSYFSHFKNIKYEKIYSQNNNSSIDSLQNIEPLFIISVTDKENNINTIKCYEKFQNNNLDTDRMLGLINNKLIVIIKYYDFDLITKKLEYFQ